MNQTSWKRPRGRCIGALTAGGAAAGCLLAGPALLHAQATDSNQARMNTDQAPPATSRAQPGPNKGQPAVGASTLQPAAGSQQKNKPQPANSGDISLNLGVDVATTYWFRGLAQQNQGLIVQPSAEVDLNLIGEGDYTVTGFLGTWNSVHSNATGDGIPANREIDEWYESDLIAGMEFGLPHNLSLRAAYIDLTNPAGGALFDQEVDLTAAYDDSDLMDRLDIPFTVSPYVLLAQEFDGGSDSGNDKGTYLELGIAPSFTLIQSENQPVTLSVPATVGLGLDNYYETATGDDQTFGYFDLGADLSTPLSFIPASYGAWSVSAGVHYIHLGDNAATISGPSEFDVTDGSKDNVYGTFGLSMTY